MAHGRVRSVALFVCEDIARPLHLCRMWRDGIGWLYITKKRTGVLASARFRIGLCLCYLVCGYRVYHECEVAVLIGHLHLGLGPCAPAVYAAHTKLPLLDFHHGELPRGEVAAMALVSGLHRAVVEVFGQEVER